MQTYQTFYESVSKPWFAPEPWVFGVAWSIIYPLIGIAFLYTVYLASKGRLPQARVVLGVFILNLLANFAFTPLQLRVSEPAWATLDIFVVLVSVAYLEYYFWRHQKTIFFLLLPYLLWGAFATALQSTIYVTNFL